MSRRHQSIPLWPPQWPRLSRHRRQWHHRPLRLPPLWRRLAPSRLAAALPSGPMDQNPSAVPPTCGTRSGRGIVALDSAPAMGRYRGFVPDSRQDSTAQRALTPAQHAKDFPNHHGSSPSELFREAYVKDVLCGITLALPEAPEAMVCMQSPLTSKSHRPLEVACTVTMGCRDHARRRAGLPLAGPHHRTVCADRQ